MNACALFILHFSDILENEQSWYYYMVNLMQTKYNFNYLKHVWNIAKYEYSSRKFYEFILKLFHMYKHDLNSFCQHTPKTSMQMCRMDFDFSLVIWTAMVIKKYIISLFRFYLKNWKNLHLKEFLMWGEVGYRMHKSLKKWSV